MSTDGDDRVGLQKLVEHASTCRNGRLCFERMKRRIDRSRTQKRWLWASFGAATSALLIVFAVQLACAPSSVRNSLALVEAREASDLDWLRTRRENVDTPPTVEEESRILGLLRARNSVIRRASLFVTGALKIDIDVATLAWLAHDAPPEPRDVDGLAAKSGGVAALLDLDRLRTRRDVSRVVWFQALRTHSGSLLPLAEEFAADPDDKIKANGKRALAEIRSR